MSALKIQNRKGILVIPFLLIFTLVHGLLTAQLHTQFTPGLRTAMVRISEMRFDEATKEVIRSRREDPKNVVPDYLEAAGLCIGLFLNENQASLKARQARLDAIIDRIEDLPESDPNRNLFLGEIYVAEAILNGKFRNNLTAAWQFYKAYQYLTENYARNPDFTPNYIPLGVLYCAIGSLPEDYKKLASLLGFEGDVGTGLGLLRKAYFDVSNNGALDYYTNYAGFVYCYVSSQLDPSAGVDPRSLNMKLTSSSFLLYLQARISYENGHVKEAAHWLDRCPKGDAYANFYHLDYLHGRYLLGLDPERAEILLKKYITESPTDLYKKSAWRYLSWVYLMQGNWQAEEQARLKVLATGSANTGADRQAELEARQPWNHVLVTARIQFDAALYQEALSTLLETSIATCCKTGEEQAEYHYRLGRIYQELADKDKALGSFEQALGIAGVDDCYALGNSALQMGLIYEEMRKTEQARNYYRKALRYDQYPFYEGIHQKAKAGIDRLK